LLNIDFVLNLGAILIDLTGS